MKAVVAAFNQEKALVGAFSVITILRMDLFEALVAAAGGGMVELEPSKHVTWIFVLLWTAAAARTRPWLSSQLAAAGCRVQPAEPTGTLQRTLAPSKHSLVMGVSNMDCSVAI